jgi:hypothetical protein
MEGRNYEFDSNQNELIAVLAKRMTWVGRFMIALSVFAIIAGLVNFGEDGLNAIIQGTLIIILAVWTLRAAAAFTNITTTEGSDISNLMTALGELRKLYTLQYWLVVVAIILVGVGVVIAGIALAAA